MENCEVIGVIFLLLGSREVRDEVAIRGAVLGCGDRKPGGPMRTVLRPEFLRPGAGLTLWLIDVGDETLHFLEALVGFIGIFSQQTELFVAFGPIHSVFPRDIYLV